MPSYISSSEVLAARQLPSSAWLWPVAAATIFLALFVSLMELRLAARGFHATVIDSDALWLKERQRASELGRKALILVGASRVQLDPDLQVIREKTDFEPVQLAIDGSSFIPVLESLAGDANVSGTILVGYQDNVINAKDINDRSVQLQMIWNSRRADVGIPNFSTIETGLSDFLHYHMRSYADGARPLSTLLLRILDSSATPQYLITLPDRERLADYRVVSMPDFYYSRVIRNLGEQLPLRDGMPWTEVDGLIRDRIELLKPAEKQGFEKNLKYIARLVQQIRQHGGNVLFVVFPTSGLVKKADERRYPRELFWDEFARQVGASSVNLMDIPEISDFQCPDGSHLDYRDRHKFTERLIKVLKLDNPVENGK